MVVQISLGGREFCGRQKLLSRAGDGDCGGSGALVAVVTTIAVTYLEAVPPPWRRPARGQL